MKGEETKIQVYSYWRQGRGLSILIVFEVHGLVSHT